MQPGWCQPVRQEFMENECEALPVLPTPTPSRVWGFQAPEIVGGQGRGGLHV